MAAYLGIDLAVPRVVLIIELSQPDREALRNVMDYFENHARNHLVTFTEFNELIIIKPITLKEGKWNTRRKWANCRFLNHGLHHRALAVFWLGAILPARRDCTDLCSQREPRRRWRKTKAAQPVHFYHDHALPALLSGLSESWQVQELSRLWLQLVQHDAKGVLQQTLRTWFEHNCDLTQTAKALHIHVNTLRYRLQRCEDITHIKINELKSTLWLYIGMELQAESVSSDKLPLPGRIEIC